MGRKPNKFFPIWLIISKRDMKKRCGHGLDVSTTKEF